MDTMTNRNDYLFSMDCSALPDKKDLARDYLDLMINRCIQMFEYDNLPDTITSKDIEYIVQNLGYGCFTKVNDKYYIFNCSLGGELNQYYLPTIAIITNPYLNYNEQLLVDKDCIIIENDSTYKGLLSLHKKYANLIAECDISLKYCCWNSRLLNLIEADTDSAKKDALNILNKIVEGKEYGIIGGKQGLENIKTYPYSNGTDNTIKSLLELRQYLYANWYIDLGINANYNMKRESLSANEVDVNENTLLPLIDDMLQVRESAVEKINAMYGLNISVHLNSSWEKIKSAIDNEEKQVEEDKEEVKDNEVKRDEQSNDNEQTTSD